jgi:hypothetical protein
MPVTWTSEDSAKLLSILLAFFYASGKGPSWDQVAEIMGPEFTGSAVSQHFTKTLAKKETYITARQRFGREVAGARRRSAPSTPSKKRKVAEVEVKVKKQEPED